MSKIIKIEEGFREQAYVCSLGYPTIGYGTKLSNNTNPDMSHYDCLVVNDEIANGFFRYLFG